MTAEGRYTIETYSREMKHYIALTVVDYLALRGIWFGANLAAYDRYEIDVESNYRKTLDEIVDRIEEQEKRDG